MADGFSMGTHDLKVLAKMLRREVDGGALVKDMQGRLKAAATPAAEEAKRRVKAVRRTAKERRRTPGPALTARVAGKVRVQVRTGGKRAAGVRVSVAKTGLPRDFRNAPARLNKVGGWRHPVFGRDTWVTQVGAPGWFDDSMAAHADEARAGVQAAMLSMVGRLRVR